ncbi:MAG: hypothetical protein LBU11_03635, partial [Zoogloeaceae bacterium]|nr:hypothetical protein [Zoogloeaceae bacterium]
MKIIAQPMTCKKDGFWASSQCVTRKTKDTGVISKHPSPHKMLVLNAAINMPIPPMSKKLAAALQGCRSNVIGEGFASPPQWLRSKPRPSGRGLT